MKTIYRIVVLVPLLFLTFRSFAGRGTDTTVCPYDCCRPDGHAPLGIMTDHVHGKGEWGFSYSYMFMQMKGNQSGTSRLNDEQVLTNYMMSPSSMNMQMHMVMAMYGITCRLSVMGMFSYVQNAMAMNMLPAAMNMPGMMMNPAMGNNGSMHSASSGPGDTRLYGLYKVYDNNRQRIIVCLGLSVPTGSIHQTGQTLLGTNDRLSYAMQTGTGTWDLLPGVTYTGQLDHFSWGLSADVNYKPALNSEGYAQGNAYKGNAWFSYRFSRWFSASFRAEDVFTDRMTGYDSRINLLSSNDPNANVLNYGGQIATVYGGLNFFKPTMPFRGNRLLVEYGIPVYQNLNGVQMTTKACLALGWQYNF